MPRRLVIVGGLLVFAAFALWWGLHTYRPHAGFASRNGVLAWENGNDLFIMAGQDTLDLHAIVRRDSTYEKRSLNMEWSE